MRKKYRQITERKKNHICDGDSAYIPLRRMREIRWEESVVNSQLKRLNPNDYQINHITCHCGSISCLGTPVLVTNRKRKKRR